MSGLLRTEDRLVLSSIHSSENHFELAIEQCNLILDSERNNEVAQDLLIDNTIWNQEFDKAITYLTQRIRLEANESLKKKLALTYLWNKQGEESTMLLKEILEVTPEEKQWRVAFVEACLLVDKIDPSELDLLNTIATAAVVE